MATSASCTNSYGLDAPRAEAATLDWTRMRTLLLVVDEPLLVISLPELFAAL